MENIKNSSVHQVFKEGDLVRNVNTQKVHRVRKVYFNGHYYCYFIDDIDGYFIDTDFVKV